MTLEMQALLLGLVAIATAAWATYRCIQLENKYWEIQEREAQKAADLHYNQVREANKPCPYCGYVFNWEVLGRDGCPNCNGEGLE